MKKGRFTEKGPTRCGYLVDPQEGETLPMGSSQRANEYLAMPAGKAARFVATLFYRDD